MVGATGQHLAETSMFNQESRVPIHLSISKDMSDIHRSMDPVLYPLVIQHIVMEHHYVQYIYIYFNIQFMVNHQTKCGIYTTSQTVSHHG